MSRQTVTWIAWSLWAIAFVLLVLDTPPVNVGDDLTTDLLGSIVLLAYATTGALIVSRQPRNTIGWLLTASALLSAVADLALEYGVYGLLTRPGSVPGAVWATVTGGALRSIGFFLILTFLLLLFPTGHLPSPRWRAFAWITGVAIALFCAANLLTGDLSNDDTRLTGMPNPFGVISTGSVADNLMNLLSILLIFGCVVGCCASVVVRFRRARGIERQQLKWLVYAALWAALAFLAAWVGVFINNPILASAVTFDLCLLAIPVGVGIAILRHGLFDIDVIINRTLVYGSLTALLAGMYFACVIAAQVVMQRLTGQSNTPPVVLVASTLLIAALFNPLRHRTQSGIDRRFYRRKYDAEKTLAAFNAMLQSEIDVEQLHEQLLSVVQEIIQPAHVSLLLRPPNPLSTPQPYGVGPPSNHPDKAGIERLTSKEDF
jgi:hypothetical protein